MCTTGHDPEMGSLLGLMQCVFSLFGGVVLVCGQLDGPGPFKHQSNLRLFEHVWSVVVVTVKTLLNDTCICPFIHCMVGPTRLLCSMTYLYTSPLW